MNYDLIVKEFERLRSTPSDINEHLNTLANVAKECDHITEMGIRSCVSTWAFLLANPKKLVSYDINYHENFEKVKEARPDWEVHVADVLKVEIEPTDLLFLDTLHIGSQIRKELELHGNKVKKYIIFHDTETYGYKPEPIEWQTDNIRENYKYDDEGIMPGIKDFMLNNPNWRVMAQFKNNNGLLILKRE